MNKIRAWYAGLQAREQRVVTLGAAALGILLLFHQFVTRSLKFMEARRSR